MDTVDVQLLGRPQAQVGSRQVDFTPDKRYQLLAYLAYQGNWQSRSHLAYLFWPDVTTKTARRNLRQLLKRVRDLDFVAELEVERERMHWWVRCDIAAFTAAVENNDLDAALTYYKGPLLEGFENYEGTEFSNWLELEREHLHGRWRETLLRRVGGLEEQGQHNEAVKLLHFLLKQDGLDEEALRLYMTTAARAGQREQALRVYQQFAKHLHKELGLEPTSTTQQLAQAIRDEPEMPMIASTKPPTTAPTAMALGPLLLSAPTTSFVGRDLELAEAAHLLSQLDCRLLTLVGPGGVGKTRIALRLAHELQERYSGGTRFVALESLGSPEAIPATIAEALMLELQGGHDPLTQVMHHIAERPILLVLDNFEHLMEAAGLTSQIIQHCPNTDLLITSRERLNLAEEWLLPIEGLPLAGENATVAESLSSDAVQLFIQRARRVSPHFVLTTKDLPYALAICHLVDGSPLALELAAVWARYMSCAEIARELGASLDVLAGPVRAVTGRHQSIRATFEYSWNLLMPVEREVLRKVSIFRGGFRREAATIVAGASIAVLASLVDKSMLRMSTTGRYDRHPLIYQYTQEKLADHAQEQDQTREKHGRYYFHLLQQLNKGFFGATHKDVLLMIEEELENIHAAWTCAVELAWLKELQQSVRPLMLFYDLQARYGEGIDFFAGAAASLSEVNPSHRATLGALWVGQAWLYPWLGHYETATEMAYCGLELLRLQGDSWAKVAALNTLGFNTFIIGGFDEAREYWREALNVVKEHGDHAKTLELLSNLSLVEAWSGNYPRAKVHLSEALAMLQKSDNHTLMVYSLLALGFASLVTGNCQRAQRLHQWGLQVARELGEKRYLPHLLYGLGLCSYELEDYLEAEKLCQEALSVAQANHDPLAQTWALALLGRAASVLGSFRKAQGHLGDSFELAMITQNKMAACFISVLICEMRLRQGQARRVPEVLSLVLYHPAANQFTKDTAERLLGMIQGKNDLENPTDTLKPSETVQLEEVVGEILRHDSLDLSSTVPPPSAEGD